MDAAGPVSQQNTQRSHDMAGVMVSFQNKEQFDSALEACEQLECNSIVYQSPPIPTEKSLGPGFTTGAGAGSCQIPQSGCSSSAKTQLKYWSLLEKVANNQTNYVSFYGDLIKHHISPPVHNEAVQQSAGANPADTGENGQGIIVLGGGGQAKQKQYEEFAQFIEGKLKADDKTSKDGLVAGNGYSKMLFAGSPEINRDVVEYGENGADSLRASPNERLDECAGHDGIHVANKITLTEDDEVIHQIHKE
jgi:hypothetical protein